MIAATYSLVTSVSDLVSEFTYTTFNEVGSTLTPSHGISAVCAKSLFSKIKHAFVASLYTGLNHWYVSIISVSGDVATFFNVNSTSYLPSPKDFAKPSTPVTSTPSNVGFVYPSFAIIVAYALYVTSGVVNTTSLPLISYFTAFVSNAKFNSSSLFAVTLSSP